MVSKKKKPELIEWAEEHNLDSLEKAKEIYKRILTSDVYVRRLTKVMKCFQEKRHELLHLPACYPEYNFIELVWTAIKRYCREHTNFTKTTMLSYMNERVDMIDAQHAEKVAAHSYYIIHSLEPDTGYELLCFLLDESVCLQQEKKSEKLKPISAKGIVLPPVNSSVPIQVSTTLSFA